MSHTRSRHLAIASGDFGAVVALWAALGLGVCACGATPSGRPASDAPRPGSSASSAARGAAPAGAAASGEAPAAADAVPAPADDRTTTAAAAADLPEEDQRRIAAIQKAINETRAARHRCWAFGAADDYRLAGKVTLRLGFGTGPMATVAVLEDEPRDTRLTTCLVQLYESYRWPAVFAPGVAIELPFSFQAPQWQHTVAVSHVDPVTAAGGKMRAQVLLHEQNTGNGVASLVWLELQDGAATPVMQRDEAAVLLYVVDGQGTVYGPGGNQQGIEVSAGHTVFFPAQGGYGIAARGPTALKTVQLHVPKTAGGATQSRVLRRLGFAGSTAPASTSARRAGARRAGARPIVQATPAAYDIADGKSTIYIYLDQASTGHNDAYLGIFTAQPGMKVPRHQHPGETEILLVLEGAGVMSIAGMTYPIAPMTAVQVPPGIEHSFEVTSQKPVKAVQFYTPSGPEQRFKRMGQRKPSR